ncbi:MAG: alpha-glucan family phosphorylase, partial [Deltaproteobacteria bacterium]|nr:alpha-glucan family phosphorylase [Deltaproteobacteria bacterium]
MNLANNFWWSWHSEPTHIFRSIDQPLWRRVNHNPIAFLEEIDDDRLAEFSTDAQILAHTTHAERCLQEYMEEPNHWSSWNAPGMRAKPVAYFSLEFCIHESLPIYSGGLGVLAGDHIKSCSDLGVPVYAIGLLYRQGYFRQEIDEFGRQHEVYHDLDTDQVALELLRDKEGAPLKVSVPVAGDVIELRVWKAQVGRCPLFLLDLPGPALEKYPRTLRLYGGDKRTRIVQELVIGIGGYRVLRALGIRPGVLHLNEGHSAFATLEAIAERMEESGLAFHEAAVEVAESVVFTTHTPVAAGHDRFEPGLVLKYLGSLRERLGLSEEEFLGLGRESRNDPNEEFCMTVLALTLSRRSNAVSSLHGVVSRNMWRGLWPDRRSVDVPIGHVTNGVHVDTWLARELAFLYANCLGSDWERSMCRAERWRGIDQLDALNLWSVKVELKRKLFSFIRRREQRRRDRLGDVELPPIPEFNQNALTIGFARRFASYKRALLLFEDYDRAKRILTDPERPIQLIFAGKAHPADEPGKALLQRLVEISNDPDLIGHVF